MISTTAQQQSLFEQISVAQESHQSNKAFAPTMFTGRKKIVKPEGQTPDEFEEQVAQELFNLEVCGCFFRGVACGVCG